MPRPLMLAAALAAMPFMAHAQFVLQDSTTTADLRGIVSVGNGIAWASGTHGTVLRTEDGGFVWQGCATPPGAEKLDFRGIQAFDDKTAVVMSSGKGDLSRIYKTIDGCLSWKLVFTNPDAEGFFDAILMNPPGPGGLHDYGVLVGDPVDGVFSIFLTFDRGNKWERMKGRPRAKDGEALFAASNQSASWLGGVGSFGLATGGIRGARLLIFDGCVDDFIGYQCGERYVRYGVEFPAGWEFMHSWRAEDLKFPASNSGGAFALSQQPGVVVGGDYAKPVESKRTANWNKPGRWGSMWHSCRYAPRGYRSSIAYVSKMNTWITVGPNGADISRDDGKNWQPLRPGKDDQPDADRDWNALSLPFVVGPHGRIGRLRDDALTPFVKH